MRTTRYPKPEKRGPKPRKRIPRGARPVGRLADKAGDHRAKAKYAADLWRDLIRLKEPTGICPRCRQRKWHDTAHGFTKGAYPVLRFELDNGIPLCRPCHRRVDSDHEAKLSLWTNYIGAERYERLRLRAIARSRVDVGLTILFLEREKERAK